MAATTNLSFTLTITGDVTRTQTYSIAANAASPAQEQILTLSSGANTLTAPTGGSTPVGMILVPPTGNAQTLTLKGITGDTGIALHLTNPFIVSLASTFTTCVLTAGGTVTGFRVVWF